MMTKYTTIRVTEETLDLLKEIQGKILWMGTDKAGLTQDFVRADGQVEDISYGRILAIALRDMKGSLLYRESHAAVKAEARRKEGA